MQYKKRKFIAIKNIIEMLKMSQTLLEEDIKLIEKANKIYKSNLDAFQKFRNENRDNYAKISHNLIKIKERQFR